MKKTTCPKNHNGTRGSKAQKTSLRTTCLSDEQLLDIFYQEEDSSTDLSIHLSECSQCQDRLRAWASSLGNIELPVPSGGERATQTTLHVLNLVPEKEQTA